LFAGLVSMMTAVLLLILLASCAGVPRGAWGGLGRPTDPIPFMRDVRTGTMPSGLRYFILENAMPENRAFIRLVVKAGSLHEEEYERGLAHFVEHMAFRGTERFPEMELIEYLRSLGMRFGPDINAFVSFDRTVYMIEVPVETDHAGIRIIPETALAIIDDWSRAVTFCPEAVELERLVVIEEYRGIQGAWERIRREWLPVLFRGSRFAERMPIGSLEVIETATPAQLENFFRRWYRADNMALVFVGDFDGAALQASLADHFHIERPDVPTVQPVFDLPPPRRGNLETMVLTDPELTGTHVLLYFKREQERRRGDIAGFRAGIIDELIRSMIGFRFGDAVLDPETPFMSAFASNNRWGASSQFYVLEATAKSGRSEETLQELLRTKEAILRHGFHATEIALAKEALVSGYQRLVQERDTHASGTFMNLLTGYSIGGGGLADFEWRLDAVRQLLPGIRARDINAAVRSYFASDDIQVFIFAPESERETLPGDARIRQLVAQRGRLRVERPRAIEVAERLVPFIPERGSVVLETVDAETGATVWDLGNGARVVLYATENRNDEIVLNAMARGGTSCAADVDSVSAGLALDMMQISGLGPWSPSDLSRMLAARQVSLTPSMGSYTRGLHGSSTTGDLRTLFEMIYLSFTDQRIDPEAVEVLMDMYRNHLALRGENPQNVFSDAITRVLTGDHPRLRPLELADLPRADMDAALAFLRRGFNPADFTFVFVGNLTPELMRGYVETYIASIPPAGETWNVWTDLGIVRPGRVEEHVFAGLEEQSTVRMAWHAPAVFGEQLSITAQVLNEYLNIRLNDEIRENLGGVYWIGAGVSASMTPRGELSMQIGFACDPQRVRELSDAVMALLNETARGVTRSVFDNSVEAMLQSWEVSMQSNSFIAGSYANSAVLMNLPLSRLQRRPRYIEAVTPADVQRMVAQLLPNGPAKIILFQGQ
ncbi:MAG: insulinase family protein, partial [Treponema sp.]|nr:insulinase family protein [Treponema sp.]